MIVGRIVFYLGKAPFHKTVLMKQICQIQNNELKENIAPENTSQINTV